MAGDSRTLKLAILGEVRDLSASLTQGTNEIQTFGDKISKFANIAKAAFIAAGVAAAAYAGKLAVDGVKAAVEDEAAQLRLATTLQNVTGAKQDQIKATEDYILKTQLAYGVTDKDLRPSLDRLVRSTKDVEEAQKLQSLALDIAAGTGKDLASVTEALAKAHDGNFGALKRVGVSLDAGIIKSKDFEAATAELSKTFEGQATKQADTFEGKIRRLNEVFGEAKETVGGYIIDAITPLVSAFMDKVVPSLSGVSGTLKDTFLPILKDIWEFVKRLFTPIIEGIRDAFDMVSDAVEKNKGSFETVFTVIEKLFNFASKYLAPFIGTTLKLGFEALGIALSTVVTVFGKIVSAVTSAYNALKSLINLIKDNPIVSGIGDLISGAFGGGKASGGSVTSGTTYLVGENGPELFTTSTSGYIVPNNALGGRGSIINLTVNGALDAEGTARTIINILNKSQARGTLGAGALA